MKRHLHQLIKLRQSYLFFLLHPILKLLYINWMPNYPSWMDTCKKKSMWINPNDSPSLSMRIKCVNSRKLFMGWSKAPAPSIPGSTPTSIRMAISSALCKPNCIQRYPTLTISLFISISMILFLWASLLPCFDSLRLPWLMSLRWMIWVTCNMF